MLACCGAGAELPGMISQKEWGTHIPLGCGDPTLVYPIPAHHMTFGDFVLWACSMGMPIVVPKPYCKSDHQSLTGPRMGILEIQDWLTNDMNPKGFVSVWWTPTYGLDYTYLSSLLSFGLDRTPPLWGVTVDVTWSFPLSKDSDLSLLE